MKFYRLFWILIAIVSITSCLSPKLIRGTRMDKEPNFSSKDYTIVAGQRSSVSPPLVRVLRSGVCVFTVCGEESFDVEAAPGEQIPEGDSDFYGKVLSSDPKLQTARVRVYDLGHALTIDNQAAEAH